MSVSAAAALVELLAAFTGVFSVAAASQSARFLAALSLTSTHRADLQLPAFW